MKNALYAAIGTLFINALNAQVMENPQQAVTHLFVATDQHNWQEVSQCFYEEVLLDYSSMNGISASTLTPQKIIDSWKSILPGFEQTHHQIGNFIVNKDENKATVFCYGTASHYLEHKSGNVWTVIGSYEFELIKSQVHGWQITSMKFNYKYQDGNTLLSEKAIENVKAK